MSDIDDAENSDADLENALNEHDSDEDSDEGSENVSNEESHEIRMTVLHGLHEHFKDVPLRASVDPYVVHTVSHFKTANFMPDGAVLKVEEMPREDENGDEEWNVYYEYDTENYRIEVRVDHEDDDYYSIQVFHCPSLRIVNSGHVFDTESVVQICRLLEEDDFKSAMSILFAKYGGGNRNGLPRTPSMLEWIIEESEYHSTNSGFDP